MRKIVTIKTIVNVEFCNDSKIDIEGNSPNKIVSRLLIRSIPIVILLIMMFILKDREILKSVILWITR